MKTYQVLWRLFRWNKFFQPINVATLENVVEVLYLHAFKDAVTPARERFKELVGYAPMGPRSKTTNLVLPDGPPTLDPTAVQFPAADTAKRTGGSLVWDAPPNVPAVPELFEPLEATGCDCDAPCGCSPCIKEIAKSVAEELFADDEEVIEEAELESVIESLKTPVPKKRKRINKRVTPKKKPKK